MRFIDNINQWVGIRPKAFLIDDSECQISQDDTNIIESINNLNVDRFPNFKQLLYALQSKAMKKYKIGIIHETKNKYSSQVLSNFIKQIDPEIKLIIYKDPSELIQKSLT